MEVLDQFQSVGTIAPVSVHDMPHVVEVFTLHADLSSLTWTDTVGVLWVEPVDSCPERSSIVRFRPLKRVASD